MIEIQGQKLNPVQPPSPQERFLKTLRNPAWTCFLQGPRVPSIGASTLVCVQSTRTPGSTRAVGRRQLGSNLWPDEACVVGRTPNNSRRSQPAEATPTGLTLGSPAVAWPPPCPASGARTATEPLADRSGPVLYSRWTAPSRGHTRAGWQLSGELLLAPTPGQGRVVTPGRGCHRRFSSLLPVASGTYGRCGRPIALGPMTAETMAGGNPSSPHRHLSLTGRFPAHDHPPTFRARPAFRPQLATLKQKPEAVEGLVPN